MIVAGCTTDYVIVVGCSTNYVIIPGCIADYSGAGISILGILLQEEMFQQTVQRSLSSRCTQETIRELGESEGFATLLQQDGPAHPGHLGQ